MIREIVAMLSLMLIVGSTIGFFAGILHAGHLMIGLFLGFAFGVPLLFYDSATYAQKAMDRALGMDEDDDPRERGKK